MAVRTSKNVLVVSTLLVISVGLAACGSSEEDGSDSSDTQSQPVDETPAIERQSSPLDEDQSEGDESDASLSGGPTSPGEHSPLSASDADGDGTVTRAEIDAYMDAGSEHRVGLVAFFDENDTDGDGTIDGDELAAVEPEFAFDGTDSNADGAVDRTEVEAYVNEPGRLYRKIGLGEFFDLVDTDDDDEVSPAEIEAAHQSGQLAAG